MHIFRFFFSALAHAVLAYMRCHSVHFYVLSMKVFHVASCIYLVDSIGFRMQMNIQAQVLFDFKFLARHIILRKRTIG